MLRIYNGQILISFLSDKPAKASVTGPASFSCISMASIMVGGSLLVSSGSSRLEEVVVLRPLSWRLVDSMVFTSGGGKVMVGVLSEN